MALVLQYDVTQLGTGSMASIPFRNRSKDFIAGEERFGGSFGLGRDQLPHGQGFRAAPDPSDDAYEHQTIRSTACLPARGISKILRRGLQRANHADEILRLKKDRK
jgi:hypothetical protein